jgi:tRNA modification GTPase
LGAVSREVDVYPTDDTIAAISTAAGSSARAIVRLSGPYAVALAGRVFQPAAGRLDQMGGFRAAEGIVRVGPSRRDEPGRAAIDAPARAYVFLAPRSYTRQDVVELHVPGSGPLAEAVLLALLEAGARRAQAGEFTARAFFSGRIDLSRAEAVADLISAADDAQARAALAALGGAIHRLAQGAAEALSGALASVEASIDLGDEVLPLPPPLQLAGELRGQGRTLRSACSQSADTPDAARQPCAVLAGRPNVGKSSLLNRLTGTDRAIVCALAGTTRDVLSAPMNLGGGSLLLQDAAGFHPGLDAAADDLSAAAHAAARGAVARADIIVFVLDLSVLGFAPDLELLKEVQSANPRAPIVLVGNKIDLVGIRDAEIRDAEIRDATPFPAGNRVVSLISGDSACNKLHALHLHPVSCVTGQGIEELRATLADRLHLSSSRGGELLGLHDRQKRALLSAADAADRAAEMLSKAAQLADVAELASVELREALLHLGQISGQVVTEDILGQIFARFCVGK